MDSSLLFNPMVKTDSERYCFWSFICSDFTPKLLTINHSDQLQVKISCHQLSKRTLSICESTSVLLMLWYTIFCLCSYPVRLCCSYINNIVVALQCVTKSLKNMVHDGLFQRRIGLPKHWIAWFSVACESLRSATQVAVVELSEGRYLKARGVIFHTNTAVLGVWWQ